MVTALADYIARHGITQAEFAQRTGLPPPMISLWLNAKRRPGLDHAIAIEEATNGEIPVRYWQGIKAENNRGVCKKPRGGKAA